MIEPKSVVIDGKNFILSKFPAVAGREIVAKYPLSAIPKIGDYEENQAVMLKLMSYVSIDNGATVIPLTTQALIDNHVGGWETLAKVEVAMMEYNVSFLANGRISSFFEEFAQMLPQWITSILIRLSERSSPMEKQPSTN
jgi:hypothetical protein